MADAGRILIIPRGDYNANSTYDKLDLVKYKGTSWLAKKNATGVEPVEGEYWQKIFDLGTANNLTTTAEGFALDARQGKVLDDKITTTNSILTYLETYFFVTNTSNFEYGCTAKKYARMVNLAIEIRLRTNYNTEQGDNLINLSADYVPSTNIKHEFYYNGKEIRINIGKNGIVSFVAKSNMIAGDYITGNISYIA